MQILYYGLLILSILLETSKNVFTNSFSKNSLKNETDIYKFNFFTYAGSIIVLMFFKGGGSSYFTVILAAFFAIAIWLNQYFALKALKIGSMSFTNFILGSGLIIPIIYGAIVNGDVISKPQYLLLAVLIASMALSLNIGKNGIGLKWLILSLISMFFAGTIGIFQTVHQSSNHSGELISFLRYAFIFTIIINFIGWQITERKEKSSFSIKSSAIIQAGFSGAFIGSVHIINLFLSGVMLKVIFFPIVNGGLIFATLISDLIFFKEKLNLKQWIGIIIGTFALCVIGL